EELADRGVDHFEPRDELVVRAERHVHRREAGLLVRVQVVRRVEQRDDVREPVHREPDQLLLPAHLAVVPREPARALPRAEPVHDHPREVAGLETLSPASPQTRGGRHAAIPSCVARSSTSSIATARADPATSWTRTTAAPRPKLHTVVASVASSRSSTGAS